MTSPAPIVKSKGWWASTELSKFLPVVRHPVVHFYVAAVFGDFSRAYSYDPVLQTGRGFHAVADDFGGSFGVRNNLDLRLVRRRLGPNQGG